MSRICSLQCNNRRSIFSRFPNKFSEKKDPNSFAQAFTIYLTRSSIKAIFIWKINRLKLADFLIKLIWPRLKIEVYIWVEAKSIYTDIGSSTYVYLLNISKQWIYFSREVEFNVFFCFDYLSLTYKFSMCLSNFTIYLRPSWCVLFTVFTGSRHKFPYPIPRYKKWIAEFRKIDPNPKISKTISIPNLWDSDWDPSVDFLLQYCHFTTGIHKIFPKILQKEEENDQTMDRLVLLVFFLFILLIQFTYDSKLIGLKDVWDSSFIKKAKVI